MSFAPEWPYFLVNGQLALWFAVGITSPPTPVNECCHIKFYLDLVQTTQPLFQKHSETILLRDCCSPRFVHFLSALVAYLPHWTITVI